MDKSEFDLRILGSNGYQDLNKRLKEIERKLELLYPCFDSFETSQVSMEKKMMEIIKKLDEVQTVLKYILNK